MRRLLLATVTAPWTLSTYNKTFCVLSSFPLERAPFHPIETLGESVFTWSSPPVFILRWDSTLFSVCTDVQFFCSVLQVFPSPHGLGKQRMTFSLALPVLSLDGSHTLLRPFGSTSASEAR